MRVMEERIIKEITIPSKICSRYTNYNYSTYAVVCNAYIITSYTSSKSVMLQTGSNTQSLKSALYKLQVYSVQFWSTLNLKLTTLKKSFVILHLSTWTVSYNVLTLHRRWIEELTPLATIFGLGAEIYTVSQKMGHTYYAS